MQLLRELASRNTAVAGPAVTQVLSEPGRYGPIYLMRAINAAKWIRSQEHMGPLAAIVTAEEVPVPVQARTAAALALGEMGRIYAAALLPVFGDGDVWSVAATGAGPIEEEPGGCGGRPAPVASSGDVVNGPGQPGHPGWLIPEAKNALVACLDDQYPRIVRRACIRACGIGSVGEALAALVDIASSGTEDPLTVLLAARAISRLTHYNVVTAQIRTQAAEHLRQFSSTPGLP